MRALLLVTCFVTLLSCSRTDSSSGSTGTTSSSATGANGATGAATTPAAGGACSLVGEWAGTYPPGPYPFSGHPVGLAFRPDGSGDSTGDRAGVTALAWKMKGKDLVFHGTHSDHAGRFTCQTGQEGEYATDFSADCATATFHLVSDPCTGRGTVMNGVSIKRK